MADISEKAVVGKSWVRTNKITIENQTGCVPTITYSVERCFEIDGERGTKALPEIVSIFDQKLVIPIRNPLDGKLTGATITMGEIYALIYSAFWNDAEKKGGY